MIGINPSIIAGPNLVPNQSPRNPPNIAPIAVPRPGMILPIAPPTIAPIVVPNPEPNAFLSPPPEKNVTSPAINPPITGILEPNLLNALLKPPNPNLFNIFEPKPPNPNLFNNKSPQPPKPLNQSAIFPKIPFDLSSLSLSFLIFCNSKSSLNNFICGVVSSVASAILVKRVLSSFLGISVINFFLISSVIPLYPSKTLSPDVIKVSNCFTE